LVRETPQSNGGWRRRSGERNCPLFPKNVRDRLFEERELEEEEQNSRSEKPQFDLPGNKARLNSFLNNDVDEREKIQ
jgi:hypothetical protein